MIDHSTWDIVANKINGKEKEREGENFWSVCL